MNKDKKTYNITITEIINGKTITTEETVQLDSKEKLHELKNKTFKERTIIVFQTREV